ncbi:hypothetical protein S726_004091 [Salmonella enterica subsp. enterica]|nr:hypothetical protein [Salmonella enterica subsp. enterica]
MMRNVFLLKAAFVFILYVVFNVNTASAYSDDIFIDFKEDANPSGGKNLHITREYKITLNTLNKVWTEVTCPTGEKHYIRMGYAAESTGSSGHVEKLSCKAGDKLTNGLMDVISSMGGENVWVHMKYSDVYAYYGHGTDDHPENTKYYVPRLCLFATTDSSIMSQDGVPLGCGFPSPSDNECKISPANIEFNYSTLSAKELNGNVLIKDISVDCTVATDALIYVATGIDSSDNYDGTISLSSQGNLKSKINVNGVTPSAQGINVKFNAGVNTLPISSTLETTGNVTTGTYSGSAVITINPQ